MAIHFRLVATGDYLAQKWSFFRREDKLSVEGENVKNDKVLFCAASLLVHFHHGFNRLTQIISPACGRFFSARRSRRFSQIISKEDDLRKSA